MSKSEEYYKNLDKRTKEYKEWKESQSKGLGDVVEDITKATGIKKVVGDCKGCEERKEKLNNLSERIKRILRISKPNQFNEEQAAQWDAFMNRDNKDTITMEQQQLIVNIAKDILNMSIKPCGDCSPSIWLRYISLIDAVYLKQNG